jgi:hypothetical protein
VDHYKPTTQTPCFEATIAAIPGFQTLPTQTRQALFTYIRARTYLYAANKASEPHELLASVMMDTELKFLTRVDNGLIRQTCRELVPRLLSTMQ